MRFYNKHRNYAYTRVCPMSIDHFFRQRHSVFLSLTYVSIWSFDVSRMALNMPHIRLVDDSMTNLKCLIMYFNGWHVFVMRKVLKFTLPSRSLVYINLTQTHRHISNCFPHSRISDFRRQPFDATRAAAHQSDHSANIRTRSSGL